MGKSPLISLALAFIGGLILGEIFSYYPLTLFLLCLSFILIESRRKERPLLPIPLFLFGAAGFMIHQIASAPFMTGDLRRHIDQEPTRIVAQIDGPPQHRPDQVVLPMKAIAIGADASEDRDLRKASGRFQLTFYAQEIPFKYGDRLDMTVRLRRPQQFRNPGAFPYADYREREGWSGVAGLTRPDQAQKTGEGGNPLLKALYRWREKIRRNIQASLEETPAALLMALVIGESGYLTDPIREAFSASGTTHILSISGSHLALVSLLIFGISRRLILSLPAPLLLRLSLWKTPSQWAALAAAGPATFYAFLAGAETATLRSLTMILVYLFAIWIGRQGEVKISLSLAALLILAFQPGAIFDISFQLSFLSVLSIALTIEWHQKVYPLAPRETPPARIERPGAERLIERYLIRPGRLMILSTLGATLGTAPLTLYYFHQFSWVGLIANGVIIPLAGGVIVPLGLFSSLLSLFFENRLPLAAWNQGLLNAYYRITSFFAQIPGGDLHFASPPLWTVVFFYGALGALLLRRAKAWRLLLGVSLFLLFFLGWGALRLPPERLRVTFLDVGQGDAALIEFPKGKTMLIDGGSGGVGKIAVAPALWQRRIRTVDYLVGTHPQRDHMDGLSYIVRRFKIGEVWIDGIDRDIPFYSAFLGSLRQKDLTPRAVSRATPPMEIDGCQIHFLNPPEGTRPDEKDFNNHSIVLRLACPPLGGISFLFTGDIEKKGERRLLEEGEALKSSVLKVPHHGGAGALDPLFLSAVSPEVALFSVGRHNPYRHPHPAVLSAYEALHASLYRTDQQGALIIEADSSGRSIRPYGEEALQRIRWGESPLLQEWRNIQRAFSIF